MKYIGKRALIVRLEMEENFIFLILIVILTLFLWEAPFVIWMTFLFIFLLVAILMKRILVALPFPLVFILRMEIFFPLADLLHLTRFIFHLCILVVIVSFAI